MSNKIIQELESEQLKTNLPAFSPGDTVVVQVKVKEGSRERLQAFEGVVIGVRNRGLNSSFTVRKISHGIGVERTFQTHSPLVDTVELKRRGDVRHHQVNRGERRAAVRERGWRADAGDALRIRPRRPPADADDPLTWCGGR